ncbi:hypothetical protein NEMBOFW57_008703 [Staphylotrichum longicolle]|uniref:Nucleotide-binding, alpha-beta plait n=1 Tax=Staphylotrichum longicolle TaxID=669026 RepID=A0AAD4ERW5_9PEZI|nr:hypothetical protein NEMBOFW57_008703 [Staphylotrichum longicolle]
MTDRRPTPLPDNAPYVRLHVTPLDAELINAVLSSALLPKARNISYHTIETFPDKRYGFLELPNEDAEKLKKKLNGAVLKGVKIRIGNARPSREPAPLAEAAMAKEKTSKTTADGALPKKDKKDKSKKRKRDVEQLSGVVLDEGRTIKRGWTSADEPKEKRSKKDKEKRSKDKKKQSKSKYTDHAECLIKTVLPANAAPLAEAENSTPTKKKKKGKSREVIIHEFERTTKFPTFLKTVAPAGRSGAPPEFVEGKGWVNEEGDVVEAVKTRPPPAAKILLSGKTEQRGQEPILDEESTATSSDDEPAVESEPKTPASAGGGSPVSEPAASDTSSPSSPIKPEPPRPRSSGSARSLSIRIPPATPNESKVHPLEALYKRPQQPEGETPKTAPDTQGFSFFANDGEGSAEEDAETDAAEAPLSRMPLTPFTRQDLESRGIRSAAPTPDTAHPSRRFTPWEPVNDNEEEEEEEELAGEDDEEDEHGLSNNAAIQGGEPDADATSDFQKWFWANRGDLNRSWKKRRKVAGKEKRYRENKARMARAI